MSLSPPRPIALLCYDPRPSSEVNAGALKLPNATLLDPTTPLPLTIGVYKRLDRIGEVWEDGLCKRVRQNILCSMARSTCDVGE